MKRLLAALCAIGPLATVCAGAPADPVDARLPDYVPASVVSGELVAWGDGWIEDLWKLWGKAFAARHPGVSFRSFLKGTSTAVGALYTSTANIGLFGREIRPLEVVSWHRIFPGYDPLGFAVAGGGYDAFAKTSAPAILVNAENPIQRISLTQLDAMWSHDRKRGGAAPITKWGQLGLTGEWADKPITIYGLDENTGTAQYLEARVLKEGRWSYNVKVPPGAPESMYKGSGRDAADALVRALETDKYAIGVAGFRNVTPKVKALAVAETDGGPFITGTRQTVLDRTYPLSRQIYIFVNKDPKKPWDPKIYEFLSFILSRQGQEAVAEEGGYLPLPASIIVAERAKLK